MKIGITNLSSAAIIYRRADPSQVFLEVKDNGHPVKLVHGQYCFIGGNWIGENAKYDRNWRDTLNREVLEELTFDRPIRSGEELVQLGLADICQFSPTTIAAVPNVTDLNDLGDLRAEIMNGSVPFGMFLNTVSKEAMDAADPANTRQCFSTLCSYGMMPISEKKWQRLERLQVKFQNLSNESITMITSLDEILKKNLKGAFGHDQVLRSFWLAMGLRGVKEMPIVQGVASHSAGPAFATYQDCLEMYDIAKKPV